ncbi:MAG: hypothetical protein KY468_15605 [Armatimonadetes bacterium]|nr:hypothetical protein [Armatimonadota bacterium]
MSQSDDNMLNMNDGEEVPTVGMGGTTGGGMLRGGTPNDVAEGRSAYSDEKTTYLPENGGPNASVEEEMGLRAGLGADPAASEGAVPIAHDEATSSGTTDAGLQAGGGTRSGTGGLISGGLPGEDEESERSTS